MPTELLVRAEHAGGMRVQATSGAHTLTTDYPLAPGQEAAGFRPMELLLAALGACACSTVALLLDRMHQPPRGLEAEVRGHRRDEHPTVFTAIEMTLVFRGPGLDRTAIEKAVAVADESLCPVWAMLRAATPITTTCRVEA